MRPRMLGAPRSMLRESAGCPGAACAGTRSGARGEALRRRPGADEAPAPADLRAAAYDAQGLPEAMALGGAEGETTLTYRYTADGQRTYKKPEGSEATRYVRDGAVTVAVVTGGSLKHWTLTLPGGEVVGRVGSGGSSRRYYLIPIA